MGTIKKRSACVVGIADRFFLFIFSITLYIDINEAVTSSLLPFFPFSSASIPRYEESRKTPRNYDESVGRTTPRNRISNRTPSYKSLHGTPHTNSSPRSMSLSGDGTPLYDES